ncbi:MULTISPECIES: hypothetical protein [unclassified Actinotalea]|uniref:hypothetical protein n=1 Tax=unclassified Actinotalea TaxID=2638618 RepID=UPI0015F5C247|nr:MULTISPECIES: hypothetical protein [unclassified Actinotalea]
MAQLEVDWEALEHAGKRLLGCADDVAPELAPRIVRTSAYGHAGLAAAATALRDALGDQTVRAQLALTGLGDGLRSSAREYSEADVRAAVTRVAMYVS